MYPNDPMQAMERLSDLSSESSGGNETIGLLTSAHRLPLGSILIILLLYQIADCRREPRESASQDSMTGHTKINLKILEQSRPRLLYRSKASTIDSGCDALPSGPTVLPERFPGSPNAWGSSEI